MLRDNEKLNHINNIYLSKISNDQLLEETLTWAKKYRPDYAELLMSDIEYAKSALSIERHTELDPKRFDTYQDTVAQVEFFFDAQYKKTLKDRPELPEAMTAELVEKFLNIYKEKLEFSLETAERFEQLKEIGQDLGFAANNKAFKEG